MILFDIIQPCNEYFSAKEGGGFDPSLDTTTPPEWEAAVREAADVAGLDLNDPGNLEWIEDKIHRGFSPEFVNLLGKIKERRRAANEDKDD